MREGPLSNQIIGAYYRVYNELGYGFLEKVYENALLCELKRMGIPAVNQVGIDVFYKNEKVGVYFADIIIDGRIILELKASEILCEEHEAQLLNYLKATSVEVGFLFNFGKKPQFKRKIFDNKYKKFVQIS